MKIYVIDLKINKDGGNMSKLIITTVGTDIIRKIGNKDIIIDKQYIGSVNELVGGTPLDPKIADKIIEQTADKIKDIIDAKVSYRFLPPEIASLMVFKDDVKYGFSDKDKIVLFYSDTKDGKFCADVIYKVLTDKGWYVPKPTKIEGLKTKTDGNNEDISEMFKTAGLKHLNEAVKNLNINNDDDNYFNITSGFKAVIPFSTIIAFNNKMSLMYLYENSDELITIGQPNDFYCPIDEVINKMNIIRRGGDRSG